MLCGDVKCYFFVVGEFCFESVIVVVEIGYGVCGFLIF